MSIKISQFDVITNGDVTTYSSTVAIPLVANITGNVANYKMSISAITDYIASSSINFSANVTGANLIATSGLYGTLRTAAQTNVTSLGTLTGLTLSGNLNGTAINAATVGNTNTTFTGNGYTSTGTFTGVTINANAVNAATIGNTGALITGTLQTAAQPNITSLGALTSLTVSGNLTAGNISTAGNIAGNYVSTNFVSGNGSALTGLTASSITGQVANAAVAGTVYANAQPNITSVGILSALTVTGNVTANKFVGDGAIPSGGIIMWSGSVASIPSGWYLCNGSNGTPDLRDRFVVGAGSTYTPGNTGGSANANVIAHTHTMSATTAGAGSHYHGIGYNNGNNNGLFGYGSWSGVHFPGGNTWNWNGAGGGTGYGGDSTSGNMVSTYDINGTGGDEHTHTLSGTTDSAGSSGTNANLPPYYALAYIMKA